MGLLRNFCHFTICKYNPSYIYTSLKLAQDQMKGLQAFNLTILQEGSYSVSLTIPDKKFDDVRQCIYTSVILFRKEG